MLNFDKLLLSVKHKHSFTTFDKSIDTQWHLLSHKRRMINMYSRFISYDYCYDNVSILKVIVLFFLYPCAVHLSGRYTIKTLS